MQMIRWLDANHSAEKEHFEHQRKKLAFMCMPMIMKLQQEGGDVPCGVEKYNVDDDAQTERRGARIALKSYAFNMKRTIDDEKLKEKISEDDRKKINDKCDEVHESSVLL